MTVIVTEQSNQKKRRGKSLGKKYWRGEIEKQTGSGLTVSEYSSKYGISRDLLYRWRSRLKKAGKAVSGPSSSVRVSAEDAGAKTREAKRFVALPLRMRAGEEIESYDIYPGREAHIRTGSCFNEKKLKQLIEMLRVL